MATETLYLTEAVLIAEDDEHDNFPCGSSFTGTDENYGYSRQLVMKAEPYSFENRYKRIVSAVLNIYVESSGSSGYAKTLDMFYEPVENINKITAFNAPLHQNAWRGFANQFNSKKYITFSAYPVTGSETNLDYVWASIVNGIYFDPAQKFNTDKWTIQTPYSNSPPYITIEFGDVVGMNAVNLEFPTSGANILKSKENTFTWSIDSPNPIVSEYSDFGKRETIELIEVVSTTLRWRYAGNETYQEVNVGDKQMYVFPANTFNNGLVEWQVSVTTNSGITTTSEWATASVQDVKSDAKAIYPIRVSLNGSVSNVFSWEHIISTGSIQTGFDLQTSKDATDWDDLISEKTSDKFVVVEKDTLRGGILYWRVRTYNSDGVAGNWSEPVQIYVVAAPDPPIVSVSNAAPRFSIRWQQTGQQAYEIKLNGSTISKAYSSESSFTYNDYLAPGEYTVQVRIQNDTGLWSDWATSIMQIENQDGSSIKLTASGNNAVTLAWDTVGDYTSFLVYRNGERIAQTNQKVFVDHFATGQPVYQVRGVYASNGYYTLSNTINAEVLVPCIMIASIKNPVWLKLRLSTSSLRHTNQSASYSVTYIQYVGDKLPSAEIGETETMALHLDCAFLLKDKKDYQAFEAMRGNLVCIKYPNGERFIGVLDQYSKEITWPMYVSYNATINIVSWKEELD